MSVVNCAVCDREAEFKQMAFAIRIPLKRLGLDDPDSLYAFMCIGCALDRAKETMSGDEYADVVASAREGLEQLVKAYEESTEPEFMLQVLQSLAEAGLGIESLLAGPETLRRYESELREEDEE